MKNQQTGILKFPISPLAKGMLIRNMEDTNHFAEHDHSRPHRDNHYLLMTATDGHFVINIDFENNVVTAPAMVIIFTARFAILFRPANRQGESVCTPR